jgi:hypothetical protein
MVSGQSLISRRARVSLPLLSIGQWWLNGLAKRLVGDLRPRRFSNRVLSQYLRHLSGDIINVSGWRDSDKEGGRYRDYYASSRRYVISNIDGEGGMPAVLPDDAEDVFLNLDDPIDNALSRQFDVVFCHTVLEHVFNADTALRNLAALSRDVVVIVVPFSQSVHYTNSYSDYHRFSPYCLKRFFQDEGFSVLLSVANGQPFFATYVVFIASRLQERHSASFAGAPKECDVAIAPGRWGRYQRSGMAPLHDPSRARRSQSSKRPECVG